MKTFETNRPSSILFLFLQDTTTYPTNPPTTITRVVGAGQLQPVYMKLDTATLDPIWVKTITYTGNGGITPQQIVLDSNGDLVLVGQVGSGEFAAAKDRMIGVNGRVLKPRDAYILTSCIYELCLTPHFTPLNFVVAAGLVDVGNGVSFGTPSVSTSQAWVAKISEAGQAQWASNYAIPAGGASGNGIDTDAANNIYLV